MAALESIISQSRCPLGPKSFLRAFCHLKSLPPASLKSKLQKLYSLPRNLRASNKSPLPFWKNLFAWAIYHPHTKYSLKGLWPHPSSRVELVDYPSVILTWGLTSSFAKIHFKPIWVPRSICIYLSPEYKI